MSSGPVFIGGLDRSGKTYMRFMLASHPSFAISKRTNLWPRFYNRFGDLKRDDNLDRCLIALADRKHIQALDIDFRRLRQDFVAGSRSYERLFALIHKQFATRMYRPRWGDQTELLEKYAELILEVYPDAKFIHMLRDPRDRYEAVIHKSQRRGGVGAATARWLYSAALAEQHQRTSPRRYKVIRYESMVARPDEIMAGVCDFLGEQYHQTMIAMEDVLRFAKVRNQNGNGAQSPLTTDYIGRFRNGLPAHETAFIQKLSKRYMRMFDYSIEPIRFSALESARLYTSHWFVNSAHMVAWHMRNLAVK